jgi:hypothetical protein
VVSSPAEKYRLWRRLRARPGDPSRVQAEAFRCGAGDAPCLIAAITEANANGHKNTIFLDAGTYTLTVIDNDTDGPNGLPSITSSLSITGVGAETTSIERDGNARPFRLIHVAATGHLTLNGLTLRGGMFFFTGPPLGGGLFNNGGTVTITSSTFSGNSGRFGGGLYNASGTVTLTNSILSRNVGTAGGGLDNAGGAVTITQSTLANNLGSAVGGGILNEAGGTVTITDSTIASNITFDPGLGGGIDNLGSLTITNSTLSGNSGRSNGAIENLGGTVMITNSTLSGNSGQSSGGIANFGTVVLQNTILALKRAFFAPDCLGVTSFGNNVIGTAANCGISLQPSDLTGDPGLAAFTDDGTPGNGHYPLLAASQAIDAGNDAVCPNRDQLGEKRHHPCDIGAIKFSEQTTVSGTAGPPQRRNRAAGTVSGRAYSEIPPVPRSRDR